MCGAAVGGRRKGFNGCGEGYDREQELEVGNLTGLGREKREWAWHRGVGLKSFLGSGGSEAVGACLACRLG